MSSSAKTFRESILNLVTERSGGIEIEISTCINRYLYIKFQELSILFMIDDSPSAIKGKVLNASNTLFETKIFYRYISGSKIYMDFSDLTTRNAPR